VILYKLIPFLFFFSGSAGLIYEVIWIDLLTNFLGSSTVAVSIILTAFMGGLATGSYTIGRLADNWDEKKIAKAYVIAELLIGFYALFFPILVNQVENFYISIFSIVPNILWSSIILKSIFSIMILFIPTFLMGSTLPLITRYLSRQWGTYSKNISLLYSLNTFGAIAGTMLAGFYLLEHYGISGATYFSASLNFLVAILFFILFKSFKIELKEQFKEEANNKQKTKKNKKEKIDKKIDEFIILLLISYTISGAAAMVYQVVWTRSLSLILGTSTYAFTTMLATFLLGIAIGSFLFRHIKKTHSRVILYIIFQIIIVVSVILSSLLLDKLPIYYLSLREMMFENWSDLNYIRFLLASAIMIIPTISMGMLFPIVTDIVSDYTKKMSHIVGKTYAINSVGAMVGAILTSMAIVPLFGLQMSIYFGAFLNLFAMSIILFQTDQLEQKRKNIIFATISLFVVSLAILSPKWSARMMSSGVYTYADNYYNVSENFDEFDEKTKKDYNFQHENIWEIAMKNYDLLYYKDGITDSVAVMRNHEGIISMMVNGKVDASAKGDNDVTTQIMIGQLPLLLHEDPKDVFLVGYASGITAGAILTHHIQSLTTAEISPTIVEASVFFNKYNNNPIKDPRMNLRIQDARHLLMTSTKKYDVIVSQPSNPWIKGQSSLFSYDWYNIVSDHLSKNGIFMQWLPAYSISENSLKIIINTLSKAFPTLTLWTSSIPGDLIILASNNNKFRASYELMLQKAMQPKIYKQLEKISLNPQTMLQELFLKGNSEIDKYLDIKNKKLEINSDDKLITEYRTPKNMANNKYVEIFTKPDDLNTNMKSLRKIIPDIELK
jgi:spermidine synthase